MGQGYPQSIYTYHIYTLIFQFELFIGKWSILISYIFLGNVLELEQPMSFWEDQGWCFLDKETHQKVPYFNQFHEMTFHKNSFEQAHLIRLKFKVLSNNPISKPLLNSESKNRNRATEQFITPQQHHPKNI